MLVLGSSWCKRSFVVVVLTEQSIGVTQKSGRDLPIGEWGELVTA